MPDLLRKFVKSFQKAISAEMDAMRARLGPFEVFVSEGQRLPSPNRDAEDFYSFHIDTPNDKLLLHAECTLAHEKGEYLVTITGLDKDTVILSCSHELKLDQAPFHLVIYPWFLYEKLIAALASLLEPGARPVENPMTLFGKRPPVLNPTPARIPHAELNESQRAAIQLCCDSNLAFVWGPPGTGKTTTLGHIVTELLAHDQRILITSTTNAAVDQALGKLACLDEAQPAFEGGYVVRVGQSQGDTHGASLNEVVNQLNAKTRARLKALRTRLAQARRQSSHCGHILEKLDEAAAPQQADLFSEGVVDPLRPWDLSEVFGEKRAAHILSLPPENREECVNRRKTLLERVAVLCQEGIAEHVENLRSQEGAIVKRAKVVLATMTNVYISKLLADDCFDVVIVEEAGMAILPSLFYCASLARNRIIAVGDPMQLPPIVQSRSAIVRKAMGRSIFEVTVPEPHAHETVVMLDTQYRMHPVIGDLISEMFYEGKLINGANTAERSAIADQGPYPGHALVVVDTAGRSTCATHDGSYSRFNKTTAQFCVDLAREAIRNGVESAAIITPYAEQSRLIRQYLSRSPVDAKRIECQTVHRFQGNERDFVIIDTVDTAPFPPGVLLAGRPPQSTAKNLINVSISRARGKLVLIADKAYFEEKAPTSVLSEVLGRIARDGLHETLP
jgi:AAA domain-containing protein